MKPETLDLFLRLPKRRESEYYKYTPLGDYHLFSEVEEGTIDGLASHEQAETVCASSPSKALDTIVFALAQRVHTLTIDNDLTDVRYIDIEASAHNTLDVFRLRIEAKANTRAKVVLRLKPADVATILLRTNVNVEEGAHLDLVLQQVSAEAKIVTQTIVEQSASSELNISTINIAPGFVRNELIIDLNGEDAQTTANGLYVVNSEGRADNNTLIVHNAPRCQSNELYKGIVDRRGVGAFAGKILVTQGAQKTVAQQTNRTMLLDQQAQSYSQPQLEIYADDVKCGHGSTTGQLDEAQLFYMQARGIDRTTAQKLLMSAFAIEVIDQIGIEPLRDELRAQIIDEDKL